MNYQDRNVNEEMELVTHLNRESFGSRNWTAAHVRLGEMQVSFVFALVLATFCAGAETDEHSS